jgi:hypothetical protein
VVGGLQKSDFRLFDNGHPQRLTVDLESSPVSIATAVQANLAVRDYVPFIAKTGNLIDALLAGENGESALVTYGDDVRVVKPFDSGELSAALKKVSPSGRSSRMLDVASRAIEMLKGRPASHARILLLVGAGARQRWRAFGSRPSRKISRCSRWHCRKWGKLSSRTLLAWRGCPAIEGAFERAPI